MEIYRSQTDYTVYDIVFQLNVYLRWTSWRCNNVDSHYTKT